MAYPANMAPQGFLPVNLIGGRVYNAAIRQIPIASGYAQNIGYGDLVTYTTDGTIVRLDTTSGAKTSFGTSGQPAPIGIFLGCQYSQSTGLKYTLNSQYWPSGTSATDAMAFICEDPEAIFKITVTDASGVLYTTGGATQAVVGQNIGYYQPATLVNTVTGNSTVSANLAGAAVTATLPLRIVDLVRETALSDGSFQQILVTYNAGFHFYRQTTGL